MMKGYFNYKTIILSFLVLVLLFLTNFFKNFLKLYSNNLNERVSFTYRFCENESIGYLKYLNYLAKDNNPAIINYVHTPPVEWSIFEPSKLNKYSTDTILLNYPGEIINLNYQKKNDNIFEIYIFKFFY